MELSEEDYLEHYGVRGMKWGVRRRNPETKALDKASKAKDRAAVDAKIDAARKRIDSGKAKADYKKAKAKYDVDRHVIGKREAKKALQKVKDKNVEDYYMSQAAKSGKETTKAVLTVVGLTAVSVLLRA